MDERLTTTWTERLAAGDSQVAQQIWQDYYDGLVRFARARLAGTPRRAADEEDVVVVAFNSFFRGVGAGRFPRLDDRDDLWQVLLMLTARKAIDLRQHENRQKRGGGKTQGESSFQYGDSAGGIGQVIGTEPSPEFAAQITEQVAHLLAALDDPTLRDVAVAKLEGFTNQEIAELRQCGLRTVERKLKLIRAVWEDQVQDDSP